MAYPVLFMIQHLHHGGTEDHFHDLVTGIDPRLIEPHVIHFNHADGDAALRIAKARWVRKTFMPVSKAYNLSGLSAVAKVRRYIRQHEIRAIVTYHFVADFIGTLAAWGGSMPPVVSSRRDMGFTRTVRQIRIGPWLDRGVRRYIAVSAAVRQALIEREHLPAPKMEVIYNGIDSAELLERRWDLAAEREKLGIGEGDLVIGCVANFSPVKNHLLLLEAFARLRPTIPGLRLLLAGDGPLREEIEQRIRDLKLEDAVILAGFSQEVSREFQLSDIVVLPSETEGLSNALIKAMALGKPIVACRVGGNPEVVTDGETGLLVESHQPAAFAEAMASLAKDPAIRQRMGQAGVQRAQQHFSKKAMMQNHENLLVNLIENTK